MESNFYQLNGQRIKNTDMILFLEYYSCSHKALCPTVSQIICMLVIPAILGTFSNLASAIADKNQESLWLINC